MVSAFVRTSFFFYQPELTLHIFHPYIWNIHCYIIFFYAIEIQFIHPFHTYWVSKQIWKKREKEYCVVDALYFLLHQFSYYNVQIQCLLTSRVEPEPELCECAVYIIYCQFGSGSGSGRTKNIYIFPLQLRIDFLIHWAYNWIDFPY